MSKDAIVEYLGSKDNLRTVLEAVRLFPEIRKHVRTSFMESLGTEMLSALNESQQREWRRDDSFSPALTGNRLDVCFIPTHVEQPKFAFAISMETNLYHGILCKPGVLSEADLRHPSVQSVGECLRRKGFKQEGGWFGWHYTIGKSEGGALELLRLVERREELLSSAVRAAAKDFNEFIAEAIFKIHAVDARQLGGRVLHQ